MGDRVDVLLRRDRGRDGLLLRLGSPAGADAHGRRVDLRFRRLDEPGCHQRHSRLHAHAGRVDADARVLGRLLQRNLLAGPRRAHLRRRGARGPVRHLDRVVASGCRPEGPHRAGCRVALGAADGGGHPALARLVSWRGSRGWRSRGRGVRRQGRQPRRPAHGGLQHGHRHGLSRRPARRVVGDGRRRGAHAADHPARGGPQQVVRQAVRGAAPGAGPCRDGRQRVGQGGSAEAVGHRPVHVRQRAPPARSGRRARRRPRRSSSASAPTGSRWTPSTRAGS